MVEFGHTGMNTLTDTINPQSRSHKEILTRSIVVPVSIGRLAYGRILTGERVGVKRWSR